MNSTDKENTLTFEEIIEILEEELKDYSGPVDIEELDFDT